MTSKFEETFGNKKELGSPARPGRSRTLGEREFGELLRRYQNGEQISDLAVEYGVKEKTLRNRMYRHGIRRPGASIEAIRREMQHEAERVTCENINQSHRENLSWAIEAAGRFLRTKAVPRTCPNDAAYFLYKQAVLEPKDFLTKVNQLELKRDRKDGTMKKMCQRGIQEIDEMLSELNEVETEQEEDANSV